MNKTILVIAFTLIVSCITKNNETTMEPKDITPGYTFVSISTPKAGKMEDLIRIAKAPSEKMDKHIDGLIARQVSVDRDRNSVVVWVTFDSKETLYNYLETEQGKDEHGENEDMESIIESFVMYDLEPVSGRLLPKK